MFEMDPCTGSQQLQMLWRHFRTGCHWIILIMLNGFDGSGLICSWRNVQAKFGRWGRREGEATSDGQQIWASARAKWWEVTSLSCHIQHSWLWFAGCRIARIWFELPNNSKPRIQIWGTVVSWLISSTKMAVWKSHTLWHLCWSIPWSRMNWKKRIWDYIPMAKQ
jgi:hypothetical protein